MKVLDERRFCRVFSYLLSPLSFLYFLFFSIYRWSFKCNIKKRQKFNGRVLSVGNLTVGGTGKTPFVIFLAKLLSKNSKRSVIVTRGYKRREKDSLIDISSLADTRGIGDEPWLMSKNARVPIVVASNKAEGCRYAIEKYEPEFIILDDGFQSFQIEREFDIILLDATDILTGGFLLPAGRWREPVRAAKRADIIIITRCDQIAEEKLKDYILRLKRLTQGKPILCSVHKPLHLEKIPDEEIVDIERLRGKKILALCSIGNNNSFIETLKMLDFSIECSLCFLDHHMYSRKDIEKIKNIVKVKQIDAVVTTQKDMYSLKAYASEFEIAVYSLFIEISLKNMGKFETVLKERGVI